MAARKRIIVRGGVEYKSCSKCNKERLLDEFSKSKNHWDGKCQQCKKCQKEYYEKNKKVIKNKRDAYRKAHPELIREQDKRSRIKRSDYCRRKSRLYYDNHRETIRKYQREYKKRRIKSDPNFKLRSNISRRILLALKSNNVDKTKSTIELIGCSISELKSYIESLFREGMTWETHGYRGWHIDHIQPCCTFDLTHVKQQEKCFHYTNLQPLWWWENLKKGSK